MRLIVRTLLRTRAGALRSLGAAAVLNCLLFCLTFPAPAAQDHFEDLRAKWFQLLTGGTNFNLNDPQVKPALSALDATAASNWKSMVTNQMTNRPYLWTNLTNSADAAEITKGYDRLRSMALAYATYGSAWKGDAGLAASIQDGLIWMTNRYNQTLRDNTTNWYDLEIGATLRIADIAVLMYGAPGVTNLADSLNVMDYFVPSPYTSPSNRNTGANLADKIRVVAIRGAVVNDSNKLVSARNALTNLFPYVKKWDGFYIDGSFIQHTNHPYNGGYGAQLLEDVSLILPWLQGSPWECTDLAQTNIIQWIYNAFEPFLYRGAMMDMTRGREVSRSGSQDHEIGADIIQSILRLSEFATNERPRMRSMVKYWAQADTFRDFIGNVPLPLLTAAEQLVSDTNTLPRAELIGHWTFASMDRVVHLRPGWGLGLSMSSSRIYNYETIKGENVRGWFTGDGMTYLYTSNDLAQFSEDFWPTVDPSRLPGTTVDTANRAAASGANYLSSSTWVGGATLLSNGVAGMDFDAFNSSLIAKKSWFMFDDEVVCLGTGITGGSNGVETIVENRRLGKGGMNDFMVNDVMTSSTLGWSNSFPDVNWCWLAGAGGYYFPGGTTLSVMRQARSNSWRDINVRESTNAVSNNYLTMSLNHGLHPVNSSYAYVLLPNFAPAEARHYAFEPEIVILANSTNAQAVKETKLNIVAANFWSDAKQTNDLISVDKKASILTQETASELAVAVADPTQVNTGSVVVNLARKASRVVTNDPGMTVNQLSPTIKMTVNVKGAAGRSFIAKFELSNSPPILTPIADRTINAGDFLAFTNSANDPDMARQKLSFHLLGTLTEAALTQIDATNALFTWRPAVSQAGTTNQVGVVVADNGSPSLSATQFFTVKVNMLNRPVVRDVTLTNGNISFRFAGDFGPDYDLQSSTNLKDWNSLLKIDQPSLPFGWTDTNALSPQRFYRLLLTP